MSIKHYHEIKGRGTHSPLNTWLASRPQSALFEGCAGSSFASIASEIFESSDSPVFVFLESSKRCDILAQECSSITGVDCACVFPSRDAIPYNLKSPFGPTTEARFKALANLMAGKKMIYIAPSVTLMQKIPPPLTLFKRIIRLKTGDSISPADLAVWLAGSGFRRESMADNVGTFAARGDIFDIYPFMTDDPVRLEFFGDTIESIRVIDVFSQKSKSHQSGVEIYPMSEFCFGESDISSSLGAIKNFCQESGIDGAGARNLEHSWKTLSDYEGIEWYLHWFKQKSVTVLDYLPSNTCIIWNDIIPESQRLEEQREIYRKHIDRVPEPFRRLVSTPEQLLDSPDTVSGALELFPEVYVGTAINNPAVPVFRFSMQEQPSFPVALEPLFEDLKTREAQGYQINILCENLGHAERMAEILAEPCPAAQVSIGYLERGYIDHEVKKVLYAENQIFSRPAQKQGSKKFKSGSPLTGTDDLSPDDYVVHIDHGIGRFAGIERVKTLDFSRDCMTIIYQDSAKLYVPVEDFHKVQKYIGKDSAAPPISKLGTGQWEKLKQRTGESVKEMARELIELYAKRQYMEGIQFSPDTVWQKEFEDSFPFEETPDQHTAIADVKRDMEAKKPMDRLVCGDVGFGKTEVALRAAFKAVCNGYQVAVLAPTTILVAQHYQTFRSRLAAFPASVGMLSRFLSAKEQKPVVEKLKSGEVDIVIGTHRLLSKDIEFKNLGLIIIDEEQRFGVRHKEKLKHYRYKIDVLSMTATPIPRTLHLSLIGARDLSIINTPPANRLPIETKVLEYHDQVMKDAVENELDRGGQVYVVNNRIGNLHSIRDSIEQLVPRARVAVAHGQMDEKELEHIMKAFIAGSFDVLVSTVIIENGLDITNVNTILVLRADAMGLSQLYQLRGRVGRSSEQAYAYLFTPPFKELHDLSLKRLKALEQYTELGSGFQIAMRDLELRGAGNILGHMQHGFISAVGFEMYCRLLKEAVDELSGTPPAPELREVKVDVPMEAFIPPEYVAESETRVSVYRQLAGAAGIETVQEISSSLIDRFGPFPVPTSNLLLLMKLKIMTRNLGATQCSVGNDGVLTVSFDGSDDDVAAGIRMLMQGSGRQFEVVYGKPVICKTRLTSTGIVERASEALGVFDAAAAPANKPDEQ